MSGEQLLRNKPLFGARLNVAHSLAKGMVGCWLFNEQMGLRLQDSSLYSNHGRLSGFPSGADRPHQGLIFDGVNSQVIMEEEEKGELNFERTDPFSIFLGLKPSQVGLTTDVLCRMLASGTFRGWAVKQVSSGELKVVLASDQDVAALYIEVSSSTIFFAVDTWVTVLLTYTGSSVASGIALFKNGVSEAFTTARDTLSATMQQSTRAVRFGIYISDRFAGEIAVGYIWNRALNARDAKALDANPYAPMGQNLFM